MWHIWGTRDVHTGFWWGRPEGKKHVLRPRHRGKDNIKRDLQEVGWGSIYWIDLEGPGSRHL
jgi:hypothetical protein